MKIKKFLISALTVAMSATGLIGITASAESWTYEFKLGKGESGYTNTYSTGNSSYGAVKTTSSVSNSSYYTAAFYNGKHEQASYSVIVNVSSVLHSDYYPGKPASACVGIRNTDSAKTCSGTYNPDGSNF